MRPLNLHHVAGSTRSAPFARHSSTLWTSTSTPPPGRVRRRWPPSRVPKNQTPRVLQTRWVPVLSLPAQRKGVFHFGHLTPIQENAHRMQKESPWVLPCTRRRPQAPSFPQFLPARPFTSTITQSHIPCTHTCRARTHTHADEKKEKKRERRGGVHTLCLSCRREEGKKRERKRG